MNCYASAGIDECGHVNLGNHMHGLMLVYIYMY